jgi:hypothetical protein
VVCRPTMAVLSRVCAARCSAHADLLWFPACMEAKAKQRTIVAGDCSSPMGSLKTQQENLSVFSIGGCLSKGYADVSMYFQVDRAGQTRER